MADFALISSNDNQIFRIAIFAIYTRSLLPHKVEGKIKGLEASRHKSNILNSCLVLNKKMSLPEFGRSILGPVQRVV